MDTRSKKNKTEEKENKNIYNGPGCLLTDTNNKDVIHKIMKFLSAKDVACLGGTCNKMQALSKSENLWYYLLLRDYNVKRDPLFDKNTSNKEIYKQEKEFEEINKRGEFSGNTRTWELEEELDQILHWSCGKGMIEVAKCCLRRGANIDEADEDGWTALIIASRHGHKEIVEFLLNNGADINKANKGGHTALVYASIHGYKEIAELVLNKGADINKVDDDGWTALMAASCWGYKEVVQLLLNNGADINKTNTFGATALMCASMLGRKEVVELLLYNEADMNKADINGRTALMIASLYVHTDIAELLEK
jgi:ankyrin repeat protein